MSSKSPILCRMGLKTLTRSISPGSLRPPQIWYWWQWVQYRQWRMWLTKWPSQSLICFCLWLRAFI